jgi:hypothetical protein
MACNFQLAISSCRVIQIEEALQLGPAEGFMEGPRLLGGAATRGVTLGNKLGYTDGKNSDADMDAIRHPDDKRGAPLIPAAPIEKGILPAPLLYQPVGTLVQWIGKKEQRKEDDLCGQDSVVGSDGFDGLNDEGVSDYFGY